MILRDYQEKAKRAFYKHLQERDDSPCVVLPTGAGKTPLIASIAADVHRLWGGRMMILAHVKELIEQSVDKIKLTDPTLPVGVYSAGLKSRQTQHPITVAGIQSVYERAHEFGALDLILVDEAHLIPAAGNGMYRQFLRDARTVNPDVRIGGLTATPYRLDVGEICTPENILNDVCYEVGVKELIRDGYLCRVKCRAGKTVADLGGVHVRGGEFIADEMAAAFDTEELVESACREIVELTNDRRGVLVFCCSVAHAEHVRDKLRGVDAGAGTRLVTGETPSDERAQTLSDFKKKLFKYLVNVNVLTTGFDATHVDCVVLLRATLSPGLYYQMVGRGFRLHPGKEDCVVLDFGTNVRRHGPVDSITRKAKKKDKDGAAPVKQCPGCEYMIHASYSTCPECGYVFPLKDVKHGQKADSAPVLSGEVTDTAFDVKEVRYRSHTKRGTQPGEAPPTLRVDYHVGWNQWKSEWVCVEHVGFARVKALAWWKLRSTLPMPDTVEKAIDLATNYGGLAAPTQITFREVSGEQYGRVVNAEIGDPFEPHDAWEGPGWMYDDPQRPAEGDQYSEEEIPF